jgi:hypothetical protein
MYNSFLYLILCEGGIQCNATKANGEKGAVCGGYWAYMNDNEITTVGLDVGRDYCLSGKFSLDR